MSKIIKSKKHIHFHWIHFVAGLILGSYFLLSKINTLYALTNRNYLLSFIQIYLFGAFFACSFLYIFSHDKFLPMAKEIENKEKNKEKRLLHKYIHNGKLLTTVIVGTIGGPVFSALTARFLLDKNHYKYLVVILSNFLSTIITVGLAKPLVDMFGF